MKNIKQGNKLVPNAICWTYDKDNLNVYIFYNRNIIVWLRIVSIVVLIICMHLYNTCLIRRHDPTQNSNAFMHKRARAHLSARVANKMCRHVSVSSKCEKHRIKSTFFGAEKDIARRINAVTMCADYLLSAFFARF